jgi:hypothetical protein
MTKRPISESAIIFLRHEGGATHALRGRKLTKLLRALERGEGQEELTALIESGYMETMAGYCVDSLDFPTAWKLAHGG